MQRQREEGQMKIRKQKETEIIRNYYRKQAVKEKE